jgi:hypothetical protein
MLSASVIVLQVAVGDAGAAGVDVARAVERQPALLLRDGATISRGSSGTAVRRGVSGQSAADLAAAWEHGLASDGDGEWLERRAAAWQLRDEVAGSRMAGQACCNLAVVA